MLGSCGPRQPAGVVGANEWPFLALNGPDDRARDVRLSALKQTERGDLPISGYDPQNRRPLSAPSMPGRTNARPSASCSTIEWMTTLSEGRGRPNRFRCLGARKALHCDHGGPVHPSRRGRQSFSRIGELAPSCQRPLVCGQPFVRLGAIERGEMSACIGPTSDVKIRDRLGRFVLLQQHATHCSCARVVRRNL
jgi:hypothetical protein